MRTPWALAAAIALFCQLDRASAQEEPAILAADPSKATPDAIVSLKGGLVSAGIGYEWGRGTIVYQGKQYAFCIRGLTVGDVGAADIRAEGAVFHMSSLDEFPGRYSAVSLGAAVIKGESSALLKNQRGVTMQLETRVTGLRFNISASGIRIVLAGAKGCPVSPAPKH